MRHPQIEQFVADLKQLWRDAGEPQFAALAARCGVGKTSLNDAVNRTDRLPTERVLRELLSVIKPEDTDSWVKRRQAVHHEVFGPTSAQPSTTPEASPSEAATPEVAPWWRRGPKTQLSWLHLVGVGAALSMVSAALTAVLLSVFIPRTVNPNQSAATWTSGGITGHNAALQKGLVAQGDKIQYAVTDNSDPADTRCLEDAIVFGQKELPSVATVKVIFSNACNAWWARLERVDGQHEGNEMTIRLIRYRDLEVMREATHSDDYRIYTHLLVDHEDNARYCASAVIKARGVEHTAKKVC